jgi:hypothetical protein
MDKTTPQSKRQDMNSTSHEEAMCDKAAHSSLDGMVDSSAASFNAKSVSVENAKEKKNTVGSIKWLEDLDHCKEMLTMTCVWKQNRLVPRRSIW